ncbi:MAG TPA: acyl-phosphate glycerol 3-phosphate acyltransferase [Nitrospiraceae bacterium]|jgi:glycerol-3-phosphate acyltransferase PlsY|nr:acyl-phosphate glycerol 3-phosphate acyltransferase [Nitrospiraceae bacterium]
MILLALMVLSFLMGSVPFGYLTAKMKGVSLREVGSGNIGATNVLRSVGKLPAILTLVGDIGKGTLAVVVARHALNDPFMEGIVGLSAIAGHNFSIFLRFKGGKGVATSIGVLLAYSPRVALITIVLWVMVVYFTKYSSLGALFAFVVLPLTMYLFDPVKAKVLISVIMTLLLILKHADNIQRLIRGTEAKLGEKI